MSKRKLQADFIFNAGYVPPRNTGVHIVEARYGEISEGTIVAGVAAIEKLKEKRELPANHMILVSVNLDGQHYNYPHHANALKAAIQAKNPDRPVILLTHTDDAAKIYKSLDDKGCKIRSCQKLYEEGFVFTRPERFITTTSAGLSIENPPKPAGP